MSQCRLRLSDRRLIPRKYASRQSIFRSPVNQFERIMPFAIREDVNSANRPKQLSFHNLMLRIRSLVNRRPDKVSLFFGNFTTN